MKKCLLAAVVLFACSLAQADSPGGKKHGFHGCKASDLNGDWVAYQAEVLKNPHTGVCKFSVSDGDVNGTCDFTLPNATGLHFVGSATVNPDCSAVLTMDFAPAPFVSTFEIQLDRVRKAYVGRWSNTFGAMGPTNGVKTFKAEETTTPNWP